MTKQFTVTASSLAAIWRHRPQPRPRSVTLHAPRRSGIIKAIARRVDALRVGQRRTAAALPEERVAILYNDASTFTVSTMEAAEQYAKDLGLVPFVASYNGTAYPNGRILPLLREVKRQGMPWLLVVALDPDGLDAARGIVAEGLDVAVQWVTSAPAGKFFLPAVGLRDAEYFMVPAQWDASLLTKDPVFGSNANYIREFNRSSGYIPTYTTASGTAAAMALLSALKQLPVGEAATPATIAAAMRDLDIDTFFGRILFNRYQRNFGGQPVTLQYLDGVMAAVLPSEYASRPLVLSPPSEADRTCTSTGLYSETLQCLREQSARRLLSSVAGSVGAVVGTAILAYMYWRWKMAPVSRRLIGASRGEQANQKDLPYELRNKYEAVAVLGSGSYGVVIAAWQLSDRKRTRRRAIKLVHARHRKFEEKDLRRLNREATILGSLDCPYIVQYLESGTSRQNDVFWFVLELLVGDPLDEWLETRGPMAELDAIKVGLDMCMALKSLHRMGVIHRDVKPANIIKLGTMTDGGTTMTSSGKLNKTLSQKSTYPESTSFIVKGSTSAKKQPSSFVSWRDTLFGKKFQNEVSSSGTKETLSGSIEFLSNPKLNTTTRELSAADFEQPSSYKLVDLGTAVAVSEEDDEPEADSLKTITEMAFAGTPAYAAPENFCNANEVSFPSDVWSLAVSLFHLVSGNLPFNEQTAASLSVAIAGDLDKPSPDIRDCVPEILRPSISSAFASVISKGMEKRIANRYKTIDEFSSELHGCLVKRGESLYSAFISYRVFAQKYHAMLLYDVLNNTTTPAGHRVIVFLDVKRLVKGEDWEDGFSSGLLNSLVALPLLSAGVIDPMTKLKGCDDDPEDNVAKELLIMQAIMNVDDDAVRKLEAIFPILVGKPCPDGSQHYPATGNFFTDGSNNGMRRLANAPSPPTSKAVAKFLQKSRLAIDSEILSAPVATTVKDLFALQGAQLWNHGSLQEEDLAEDSELWENVQKDQSDPSLDLHQLRMLKAEFRNLVPSMHEVIDRAHEISRLRRQKKNAIEEKRKALLQRVIGRMSAEITADAFLCWKEAIGNSSRDFSTKMRALPNDIQRLISDPGAEPAETLVAPRDHVVLNVFRSSSPVNHTKVSEISKGDLSQTELNSQDQENYEITFTSTQSGPGIASDLIPRVGYSPVRQYSSMYDSSYVSHPPPAIYLHQNPSIPFFLAGHPNTFMPY